MSKQKKEEGTVVRYDVWESELQYNTKEWSTSSKRNPPSVLVEVSDNESTLSKPITICVTDFNQLILVNLFND